MLALSAKVYPFDRFIWISANRFALTLGHGDFAVFPAEVILSLFRRLADRGHFVELKIRFKSQQDPSVCVPKMVVKTVVHAAAANSNLEVLDVTTKEKDLKWDRHVSRLFEFALCMRRSVAILSIVDSCNRTTENHGGRLRRANLF